MRDHSSSSQPGFISVRKSEHDREIRLKQMNGAHIMQRTATWKVVAVGAAMAGLGVLGTGAAMADDTNDTERPIRWSTETTFAPSGDGDASPEDSTPAGPWTPVSWYVGL
jgi:hypothetical protein